MGESADPPFETTYKNLFSNSPDSTLQKDSGPELIVEESELPLIDLNQLNLGDLEKQACQKLIAQASREWGFFQVINHGISRDVLETMRAEQVKLMKKPFLDKTNCKDSNLSAGSYRWGTPSATSLEHLSWSEAFHVSLTDVLGSGGHNSLSSRMEQFATTVLKLAQTLADILAEEIGDKTCFFKETCLASTCYLRLNRYPPCPLIHPYKMFGIIPHTDSDFLTVLYQDNIGGLQLVKDGRWIAVKPNPQALIINIGDLFQAWSNNVYKSVKHRVVANARNERFSTAFLFCPSSDTVIRSRGLYKSFSFGEYRQQVQQDVDVFGHKIGLSRFLASRRTSAAGHTGQPEPKLTLLRRHVRVFIPHSLRPGRIIKRRSLGPFPTDPVHRRGGVNGRVNPTMWRFVVQFTHPVFWGSMGKNSIYDEKVRRIEATIDDGGLALKSA
ncbi:Gibberellin 2-beta-dioxygenase 8 [Sesamum alatum]|uniref:Gibberellin 2-beta-dioxygenase 8 n=1 Tax=Sesamum alatum TaxID=300844 RepID=A0AAE1Z0U1_9LAMI|nr:Gibberellin 2-beta-dioxygenase 8 [Sesamum alatum]